MNSKDSDIEAFRKEFVTREEYELLQKQLLLVIDEMRTLQEAILELMKENK